MEISFHSCVVIFGPHVLILPVFLLLHLAMLDISRQLYTEVIDDISGQFERKEVNLQLWNIALL